VIPAGFESACACCGEWIIEGEAIGKLDGEWCCQVCIDEAGGEDES
jgi:hypothetical protein